jgi:hypothetical protein
MQWERVWSTYMGRYIKSCPRASARVSLLELPEERRQTPSVSLPSTVVSAEPPVKIGLSDSVVTLFYL